VKENVSAAGIQFDEQDSSCTRSDSLFKEIFEAAGLVLIKEQKQIGFPAGLYEVKLYLLQ
jgi:protein N-terminal methyltransferase